MECGLLGLSGCAVSALAPGTLTFGNETSEASSSSAITRPGCSSEASDAGAPDYPYGERGQSQRDRRISGGASRRN
jgi:hypothetical protein